MYVDRGKGHECDGCFDTIQAQTPDLNFEYTYPRLNDL